MASDCSGSFAVEYFLKLINCVHSIRAIINLWGFRVNWCNNNNGMPPVLSGDRTAVSVSRSTTRATWSPWRPPGASGRWSTWWQERSSHSTRTARSHSTVSHTHQVSDSCSTRTAQSHSTVSHTRQVSDSRSTRTAQSHSTVSRTHQVSDSRSTRTAQSHSTVSHTRQVSDSCSTRTAQSHSTVSHTHQVSDSRSTRMYLHTCRSSCINQLSWQSTNVCTPLVNCIANHNLIGVDRSTGSQSQQQNGCYVLLLMIHLTNTNKVSEKKCTWSKLKT